jgi:hypothetical protein
MSDRTRTNEATPTDTTTEPPSSLEFIEWAIAEKKEQKAQRKWALKELRDEAHVLAKTAPGRPGVEGRDSQLIQSASRMGGLVNMEFLNRDDVHDELRPAVQQWGDYDDDLARDKIDRCIDDAARDGITLWREWNEYAKKAGIRGIPAEARRGETSVPRGDGAETNGEANGFDPKAMPKLWNATDLKPGKPVEWLAKQRIPRSAVSLLVGEEGIGKSLFWIWIVAAITTGKPLLEFGIPVREPGHVIVAVTEDDWQDTVEPRLKLAGADLSMIRVMCIDDDGSGAQVFPRDARLIIDADPAPVLVVIDPWLDTVAPDLKVRNTQDARIALHPFKDVATKTSAAVLLVTHTNRLSSDNPRDLYGTSATLRQKARMSLFCVENEDGRLVVGPEKANMTQLVPATVLGKQSVWVFGDRPADEGSVPKLIFIDQSDKTIREHVAEINAAKRGNDDDTASSLVWLSNLLADGPQWSTLVSTQAEQRGITKNQLNSAKLKLNVKSKRLDGNGAWFMCLPEHVHRQPEGPK